MNDLFSMFGSEDEFDGPVDFGDSGDLHLAEVNEEQEQQQQQDQREDIDLLSESTRPVKRSRSEPAAADAAAVANNHFGAAAAAAGMDHRRSCGGVLRRGRNRGGGGSGGEVGGKEVIEILSDDDEDRSRSRRQLRHRFQACLESLSAGATAASAAGTRASESASLAGGDRPEVATGSLSSAAAAGGKPKPEMVPSSSGSCNARSLNPAPIPAGLVSPWKTSTSAAAAGGGGEEGEGKPSAEEKAAAEQLSNDAGAMGGLVAQAMSATSRISPEGDPKKGSGQTGFGSNTSAAGGGSGDFQDLPLILECAMCFNPLAVTALFACGHGSCWECAHDWCSRETSVTMDCPTCHVSVPRNDLRRCIVLDQVVDRAVVAAGADDDDWRARLERGQALAREAEANRRVSRDSQRTLEDTIAKQAAELKRLKEEAKAARAGFGRRSWRSSTSDGLPASMADYGFRLMSSGSGGGGGPGYLFPESHRSAIEEFTRLTNRRVEAAVAARERPPSSRSGRMAGDAAAAAAAAAVLGAPPPAAYGGAGGMRQRGPVHSSGVGPGEGDPWFSLRPSQPNRQHGGAPASVAGRRTGREMFGRGDPLGRSGASNSVATAVAAAARGLEHQSEGAVSKSAGENTRMRTAGGSDWHAAYLNAGRLSTPEGAGGGRGASGGLPRPRASADLREGGRGSTIPGATLEAGAPGAGRVIAGQVLPAGLVSSMRPSMRVRHTFASGAPGAGAASAAGSPTPDHHHHHPHHPMQLHQLSGGVELGSAAPPGLQLDRFPRSSDGSAGAGGSEGPFMSRNRGGAASSSSQSQPAPLLDIDDLMMSGQDEPGSPSSVWDDMLASISMPH